MATSKPKLRKNDRVTLSPIKRSIPSYEGKPPVLRDTVLTVSHLTGTGSTRNPWHVVVTDGTYFWHLEPDDVMHAEGHSTKKVSRTVVTDAQIRALRDEAVQAGDWRQVDLCDVALGIRPQHTATDRGSIKDSSGRSISRAKARAACSKVIHDARREAHEGAPSSHHATKARHELDAWLEGHGYQHARARKIHQAPTGRAVFAAHERDHHITTAGRRDLARDQFALGPSPEEKRRGIPGRLPIDTIQRGRNALTRAAQMQKRGHLSTGQLAEVRRAVHRAWPSILSER